MMSVVYPSCLTFVPLRDHGRVIVDTLTGQDFPVVEADRFADQVPFPHDGGLIARGLQQLGERSLRAVETAVGVVVEAVHVAVLAGQDRGPAGAANRVGNQAAVEAHPFGRQPVQVGRLYQAARITIGTDRLIGMIVGKD